MIRFYPIFALALLFFCSDVLSSATALAQVKVVTDSAKFDRQTAAAAVPIPDSQTAFPGTSCGFGDRGPTGIGEKVEIPFDANKVTIRNTSLGVLAICIFDGGTMILPPTNTQPNFMTANTIVGNGEDDFLIEFDVPVHAVAFRLLTNNFADEEVTLRDEFDAVIAVIDIDRLTPRNERVFVGFISRDTPIKSLVIDTVNGASQNEGFDAIKVAETLP